MLDYIRNKNDVFKRRTMRNSAAEDIMQEIKKAFKYTQRVLREDYLINRHYNKQKQKDREKEEKKEKKHDKINEKIDSKIIFEVSEGNSSMRSEKPEIYLNLKNLSPEASPRIDRRNITKNLALKSV